MKKLLQILLLLTLAASAAYAFEHEGLKWPIPLWHGRCPYAPLDPADCSHYA